MQKIYKIRSQCSAAKRSIKSKGICIAFWSADVAWSSFFTCNCPYLVSFQAKKSITKAKRSMTSSTCERDETSPRWNMKKSKKTKSQRPRRTKTPQRKECNQTGLAMQKEARSKSSKALDAKAVYKF